MKWRIQADLMLDDEEEAMEIFEFLKARKNLFKTIRRGEINEERSRLTIHKCYNDEENGKPCEYLEVIESE